MIKLLIILVITAFILTGGFKPRKRRKQRKNKDVRKNSFALDIKEIPEQKYMALHIPKLLDKTELFMPSFLSKVAAQYLESFNAPKLTPEDIKEGVNYNEAFYIYSKICRDTFARAKSHYMIQNANNVEAKYIVLKITRPEVDCPHIPKEHRYKVGEEIPEYPCEDCDKDVSCLPWYSYEW